MRISLSALVLLGIWLFVSNCESEKTVDPGAKIKFDTDVLNAQGLQGPPDGLRSLSYEFCVPKDDVKLEQVKRIDPSIRFQGGSPGRIGCTEEEVLAIGNTHQDNFKEILLEIARLEYIEEIREVHFE